MRLKRIRWKEHMRGVDATPIVAALNAMGCKPAQTRHGMTWEIIWP